MTLHCTLRCLPEEWNVFQPKKSTERHLKKRWTEKLKLNVDMSKKHWHFCFICEIITNDIYLLVAFTFCGYEKV